MRDQDYIEINLIDVLIVIFHNKWKIICVAILCLILGSGIGYRQYLKEMKDYYNHSEEDAVSKLSKSQQDKIKAIDMQIEELQKLVETQTYALENTVLWKMDPNSVSRETIKFTVSGVRDAEGNIANCDVDGLMLAYQNAIRGDTFLSNIAKDYGVGDKTELIRDLVWIDVSKNDEDSTVGNISVQIRGNTETEAQALGQKVIAYINGLKDEFASSISQHELKQAGIADFKEKAEYIQQQRTDATNKIAENTKKMADLEGEKEKIINPDGKTGEVAENAAAPSIKKTVAKYAVIVVLIGEILLLGIVVLLFVMDGKLHDGMWLTGLINKQMFFMSPTAKNEAQNLMKGFQKTKYKDRRLYTYNSVSRVLAGFIEADSRVSNRNRYCFVSSNISVAQKNVIENIRNILAEIDIEITMALSPLQYIDSMDNLSLAQAVILTENEYLSKDQDIKEIINLCNQLNILVVGGFVGCYGYGVDKRLVKLRKKKKPAGEE